MDEDMLKLDEQVCFALVTAARNVVSIYRPVLEPMGLTHPQYLVMLALWESSPRSLGELAEELALDPATVSPLVKRLEAQGLVSASAAPRRRAHARHLAHRRRRSALRERRPAGAGRDHGAGRHGCRRSWSALREALAPFSGRRGDTPERDACLPRYVADSVNTSSCC